MKEQASPTRTRFRLRYSLRGLMVVVTLVAVACGWLAWQRQSYHRELAACKLLEQQYDARIALDYELSAGSESAHPQLRWEELWHGRIFYPTQGVGCYRARLDRRAWQAINALPHIKELHLYNCENEADTMTFSQLASLRRLEITVDKLSSVELQKIAALPHLQELTLARPDRSALDDQATATWAESLAPLRELKILNLENLPITATAVTTIAGMKELRELSLVNCRIDPQHLREWEQLQQLERLVISDVLVNDDVLNAWTKLRKLNYVILDRCSISDTGLGSLSQLPDLVYLAIRDAPISDDGLLQLKKLPKIRELKLNGTPLTRRSLKTLESIPSLNWSQIDFPEQLRYTGEEQQEK